MSCRECEVTAIGHGLVDIRLRVNRFPGPDEEAVILEEERGAGGSAVNVAIDVSILGGESAALVKIGFDSFGRLVYDELWRYNVSLEGVRISARERTGFSIVVIDKEGSIAIYGYKGAAEKLEPHEVDIPVIEKTRALHIASLRLDTSLRAAALARENNAIVAWDPGRRLASLGIEGTRDLLRLTDIVFANMREAMLLANTGDPVEAAKRISRVGPAVVVVKLGADGALLYDKEHDRIIRKPAYKPERVIDTTGAGDAFASGFLLAVARGYSLEEALLSGLYVACKKIERLGSHSLPEGLEIPPPSRPQCE